MASAWNTKRVLIAVRTYPTPAQKGIEVSCTAAISDDGEWIRIFPVPYRSLPPDKKFVKYQWVDVGLTRAKNDPRPESHTLNIDAIKLGRIVSTENEWAERKAILRPLKRPSMCAIRRELDEKGSPTLGIFQPRKIKRLVIEPCQPEWSASQKTILSQMTLGFEKAPAQELEKIPFDFSYEFLCDDAQCKGHRMGCTDWEMGQAYREWRKKYGAGWEAKFREKFERDMIEKFDTHFYVGTLHQHPRNWMIVGLFYPPRAAAVGDLFA
jgi:hypothetical protein